MSKVSEDHVIGFLRGEENPFDAFVVPDNPSHAFPQCHVAEVHRDEFERIGRVIDKFRNPDYHTRRQIHETRQPKAPAEEAPRAGREQLGESADRTDPGAEGLLRDEARRQRQQQDHARERGPRRPPGPPAAGALSPARA